MLSVDPAAIAEVHRRHTAAGVAAALVGEAGGDRFTIGGLPGADIDAPLATIAEAWRGALPSLLAHGTTQG